MVNHNNKRFYILSLAVLFLLSVYPLGQGVRMTVLHLKYGSLEPAQYAKYVIPYGALCLAVLLFAAFQPLLFKTGRLACFLPRSGFWKGYKSAPPGCP